ncbi:MAG: collagen-like protein [Myxococcales bacterium]|nr:collagen-like protein [Myxococcales bacterium]MCB9531612.1 collagen-like protein [Myxococcales bacterium]MCB9532737.1 collagen-like protein [Myxococcales bacterium]
MQQRSVVAPLVVASIALLAACKGPVGPEGPAGPRGARGETGEPGAVGPEGPAGAFHSASAGWLSAVDAMTTVTAAYATPDVVARGTVQADGAAVATLSVGATVTPEPDASACCLFWAAVDGARVEPPSAGNLPGNPGAVAVCAARGGSAQLSATWSVALPPGEHELSLVAGTDAAACDVVSAWGAYTLLQ